MNKQTLTLGIGFLTTLIATMAMAGPDEHTSTQVQKTTAEASSVEYIHKTMEVEGQKYIWTIIIPPSAKKGGQGLLFLHGRGSSGDDGKDHLDSGLPLAIERDPESWPFVVIVPQKPTKSDWDFHERAVMQMLDQAIEEGFIDQDKIGITGLSQGGHGTMVFASMHPDRFVAAAPVCGYPQVAFDEKGESTPFPSMAEFQSAMLSIVENLKDIPVWLFHGEVDSTVPVITARVLNQTLESMGADVKYTEFAGVGHNSWGPAYAKKELGEWFAEHMED